MRRWLIDEVWRLQARRSQVDRQWWIGGRRNAPRSESGSVAHVGLVVPKLDADVVSQPSGLVGHPFKGLLVHEDPGKSAR